MENAQHFDLDGRRPDDAIRDHIVVFRNADRARILWTRRAATIRMMRELLAGPAYAIAHSTGGTFVTKMEIVADGVQLAAGARYITKS
jgi:hypothetical protein